MDGERVDGGGEPADVDVFPGAGCLHSLAGSLPLAPDIAMPRGLVSQRGCRDRTARLRFRQANRAQGTPLEPA